VLVLSLILLAVLTEGEVEVEVVFATFSVPSESPFHQGLYWTGVPGKPISKEKPHFGSSDGEHLVTVIPPGSHVTERITDGHSLVVRSADLSTRARLTLSKNSDPETKDKHPFVIRVVNLSVMDREGPFPLEVVHGDPFEFVWIDPADYIEHLTGPEHEFLIRTRDHVPQFRVSFRTPLDEL
jgi:hypothetical protein